MEFLFEEQESRVYTVSEVTREIKTALETYLPIIWVEGEISNFTHHRSGHMYFSLKDTNAQINCVMWRTRVSGLTFVPQDGMKVLALGAVRVYEKRGNYQLDCTRLAVAGVGELQLAFERLKNRLNQEGLFDPGHKKPIPEFPQTVGVITSATGAAIRDIVTVIRRRFPGIGIVLRPTLVQGDGAAADIVSALDEFNEFNQVDVIILGRGGGSLEDLWAFNEEIVARAIFASHLPVISAVGHEIDFTISDFVADLRAPTPSAAAELAVPELSEWLDRVHGVHRRLLRQVEHRCQIAQQQVQRIRSSYAFKQPQDRLRQVQQRIDDLAGEIFRSMDLRLERSAQRLHQGQQRLEDMRPQAILKRGYCLVWNEFRQEFAVTSKALQQGDPIRLHFGDDAARAEIREIGLETDLAALIRQKKGKNDEKTDT